MKILGFFIDKWIRITYIMIKVDESLQRYLKIYSLWLRVIPMIVWKQMNDAGECARKFTVDGLIMTDYFS